MHHPVAAPAAFGSEVVEVEVDGGVSSLLPEMPGDELVQGILPAAGVADAFGLKSHELRRELPCFRIRKLCEGDDSVLLGHQGSDSQRLSCIPRLTSARSSGGQGVAILPPN